MGVLVGNGIAAPAHGSVARSGDVIYVGFTGGAPGLQRFDLALESWLPPIPLAFAPRAVAAGPDALYVADSAGIVRLGLGGEEIWSVASGAEELALDSDRGLLFGLRGQVVDVYRTADGVSVAQHFLLGPSEIGGLSVAPGTRRIYAVRHSSDENRVLSYSYASDGSMVGLPEVSALLPTSGPIVRTWVFPGEDLLVDGHGSVLDADTLEWRSSLLGPVYEVDFDGADPVRLGVDTLVRFGPGFERLGSLALDRQYEDVVVYGGRVFLFDGVSASSVPLDTIVFPPLHTPPDPETVPLALRSVALEGGILSVWGGSPASVFRWSVPDERVASSVPLREAPEQVVRCPALGGLLLSYPRGELRWLPDGADREIHWRNAPRPVSALACTGDHVVLAMPGEGLRGTLATFSSDGEPKHEIEIRLPGGFAAWSEARGLLYLWQRSQAFFGVWDLGSYAIAADGTIAVVADGPAHGPPVPIHVADGGPFVFSGADRFDDDLYGTLYIGERTGTAGALVHGGAYYTLWGSSLNRYDSSVLKREAATPVVAALGLYVFEGSLVVVSAPAGVLEVRLFDPEDLDGDGVPMAEDPFPSDPAEWSDRDGDGVGDHGDVFPDDSAESADQDGDGVGDRADLFDDDPTEWSDRDGDRIGDNTDLFPDDQRESQDADGDGHGDNGDWAPSDPLEWADSDADGVGDNADLFPTDPLEQTDFDGDGDGDNGDPFPLGNPEVGLVDLEGKERVTFAGLGSARADLPGGHLGLWADGTFTLCEREAGCLSGRYVPADANGGRYDLEVAPTWLAAVEPGLEEALAEALSRAFGRTVTLDLALRPEAARMSVRLARNGTRGIVRSRWLFEAQVGNVPRRFQTLRMAWVWKLETAEVVRP